MNIHHKGREGGIPPFVPLLFPSLLLLRLKSDTVSGSLSSSLMLNMYVNTHVPPLNIYPCFD